MKCPRTIHQLIRQTLWVFWILGASGLEAQTWQAILGGRQRPLVVPKEGGTGFKAVPSARSGILFTNSLDGMRAITNQIFHNGSGVAAGDIDGDGDLDLYVTHYRSTTLRDEPDTRFRLKREGAATIITARCARPAGPRSFPSIGDFAVS